MLRNYFNYYTEIEEYFLRRRSRNLLVSPLDWCLIELWRENGIPLHVVLRGIDRSFEASARRRRRDPTTLHYCHPAIMEAFEEYREGRVGSRDSSDGEAGDSEEEIPREEVLAYLEEISEDLKARTEEACQLAGERLHALGLELRRASAVRLEELDRELEALQSGLIAELAKKLSPEFLKALDSDMAAELKALRKRLSKEMFHRLRQKRRLRKLAEHFDLPEMSLLGLGGTG